MDKVSKNFSSSDTERHRQHLPSAENRTPPIKGNAGTARRLNSIEQSHGITGAPPSALPDIGDRLRSPSADTASAPVELQRLLITIREAQKMLSLSRSTIYRCITANDLDARKVGGRTVITAESVARFAATLPKLGGGGP